MSSGLDGVAGPENYTPDGSCPGWTDNGGNYGSTMAPEGGAVTPTPQGETTFDSGPAPSVNLQVGVPPQIAIHMPGANSTASMPTPEA